MRKTGKKKQFTFIEETLHLEKDGIFDKYWSQNLLLYFAHFMQL